MEGKPSEEYGYYVLKSEQCTLYAMFWECLSSSEPIQYYNPESRA